MNDMETGQFSAKDGTCLFYRSWPAARPKAALVFCHGLGEHSGRYDFPVSYFSERGYSVYAPDLRGHGHSEGLPGHADSMNQFVEDLDHFLDLVRRETPGRKVFLIGHSFGGQLSLNAVCRNSGSPRPPDGLILSSPNIRLRMAVPFWKVLAARWLSLIVPRLALGNEIQPKNLSHDPEVVRRYETDPLIRRKITVKLGQIILENQVSLPTRAASHKIPTLFLHGGDDPICSPDGTRDYSKSAVARDKTFKIYKGYFHEIFNEVGREKVFHDMEEWLEKRL